MENTVTIETSSADAVVAEDGTLKINVAINTNVVDLKTTVELPFDVLRDLYIEAKEAWEESKAKEFRDKYAALHPEWKNEL